MTLVVLASHFIVIISREIFINIMIFLVEISACNFCLGEGGKNH